MLSWPYVLECKAFSYKPNSYTCELFEKDDCVINEGEDGSCLYLLYTGTAEASINGEVVKTYEAGGFFGEKALLKEDVRAATCKAASAVTCLSLGREDFTMMLGSIGDLLSGNKGDDAPAAADQAQRARTRRSCWMTLM